MENKPTLANKPTDMGDNFEKKFGQEMNKQNVDLTEVDANLAEADKLRKKDIWDLSKMESLVHSDPKLSAVYDEMSEDGEEKYGYHYNETIMNIIFNEYVLNSAQYLEKYKMAIPAKKKRRDKSGINKLRKEKGSKEKLKKDENINHDESLEDVTEMMDNNGVRRHGDGDANDRGYLDHRIEKKYDTMDNVKENEEIKEGYSFNAPMEIINKYDDDVVKTANGLLNSFDGDKNNTISYIESSDDIMVDKNHLLQFIKSAEVEQNVDETTTSASSGAYETPFAFASKGNQRHAKKPAWSGGEIVDESYMTTSDYYKRLVESLENDSVVPMSEDDDPCWGNYEQYGTKMKDGKEVPNCVPKNEGEVHEHHLEDRQEKEEFIRMNTDDSSDFFNELDGDIDSMLDNASDEEIDALYRSLEGEMFDESENINEKAKSKKQQKFMGMVRAIQKGEADPSKFSDDVQKAAKEMKSDDVEDFASTKHDKLPEKVDEVSNQTFFSAIQKMRGQDQGQRKTNLANTFFNEFVGRDFMDTKISGFDADYSSKNYNAKETNTGMNYVGVDINLENGDKIEYVFLPDKNEDQFKLPSNYRISRNDARILSKIAKKVNNNTKYANGTADLPIGSYMNEVNPIVGAMAAGAAGAVGEKIGRKVANKVFGEAVDSSGVVEFYKDKNGEEPFNLKGIDWIEVWAKYPDGKTDIGYYRKDQDIVYSWDWFNDNILDESIIDHQSETMATSGDNSTSMKMRAESENKLEDFGKSKNGVGGYNGHGEPMSDVNNIKNPSALGGKTKENIKEDSFCRADEEPVAGKVKGEEGACKKKKNYKKSDTNNNENKFNVEKRKEREKEYYKRIGKKPKDMAKETKKSKESVNEDKKTPSMIQVDRIKKENPKNFKSDMKDSASANYIENQDKMTAQEQYTEVDDPKKLSSGIEKEKLKQNKGEAFENEGNSTNDNNKEIPKRNHTEEEQEDVSEIRRGMHSINYDNEPDERFKERVKKDMGEEFYEMGEKQRKIRKEEPMYGRDTQKVDDGDEKEQYSESVITGKYKDHINRTQFVDFYISEATDISVDKLDESYEKLNLDGIGNTFTSRVDENVSVRNIMDKFNFYFNTKDNKVVRTQKSTGLINESEEKQPVNETLNKMKSLMNYNPNNYNGVEATKRNRGF